MSRIWTLVQEYNDASEAEPSLQQSNDIQRVIHQMIKKMTEDIQHNMYNTAIATAMTTVNSLYKLKSQSMSKNEVWQTSLESLVACVAPFAPHIADELWQQLGHTESVHKDSWPAWDDSLLETDTVTIVVQINGKVRSTVEVENNATEEQIVATAKEIEKVAGYLANEPIKKTIYVPGKLVNFVL
ncbi:class I tRNA ligase family protein [Candidatus Saccharibacteria bacterium]|nr:class I tRNA ligase family protein [Candidatus Saccharibacteria bacterium]